MAGVPISTASGAIVRPNSDPGPPRRWPASVETGGSDADSDADDLERGGGTESARPNASGGEAKDARADARADARRRATPSDYWEQLTKFNDRVKTNKFYDARDEHTWSTPLSWWFLKICVAESSIVEDAEDLVAPPITERGYPNIPTQQAASRAILLVKLTDKMFFLALRELQKLLRKNFKVEWFTLPFSVNFRPEENEVSVEDLELASDTHKEVVALFAETVNKMHQVKLLVREANAKGTEATRGFQRKTQAVTYVETVRKNMWILNNRFAYDKTLGGFYRPGDVRKGAIALITSPAAAAKVKGGPETVRPPPKKGQRWQHNKRPKKIRARPDERTPTISYPPRK